MSRAADEVLILVHNGFAGMCFMFPPPVAPLVESSCPQGLVFLTSDICLWGSRAWLTSLFFTLLSRLMLTRELSGSQEWDAWSGEKENRHTVL